MTDTSASTGESVVAMLMPDGRVSGMLMRPAVSMDSAAGGATTAAELRARRDSANVSQRSAALTEHQHAQEREIAAWLARRCPT